MSHIPYVISVDTGDQDLPLVVVDKQSSNHCGCLSNTPCHDETKHHLARNRKEGRT